MNDLLWWFELEIAHCLLSRLYGLTEIMQHELSMSMFLDDSIPFVECESD